VTWFHGIAGRDHFIQNPTSAPKIRRVGELMRLHPGCRVLDIGCGRGGPAVVLAESFGCTVTGVERASDFAEAAREFVESRNLSALVQIVPADAREFAPGPGSFDAVLCLGATFIWGGLEGTCQALLPAVRPGGHIAVGEPFWRTRPLPADVESDREGYTHLVGTAERFQAAGVRLVGLVASSESDWDDYRSLQWRAVEEWLEENPDAPEATTIRTQHLARRDRYLRFERGLLDWALFVGWKDPRL
jgi:SAM-dependent methyltransferase